MIGIVKYEGENIAFDIIDGKEYEVVKIENDMLRIIDESGEDYLYFIKNPNNADKKELMGRWVVVRDITGELQKVLS